MLTRTVMPKRNRIVRLALATAVPGVLLCAATGFLACWTRVRVTGRSMRPTLAPGDRLLVRRRPTRVQVGDLVVVRMPDGIEAVKRLAGVEGDEVALGVRGRVRLGAGEVAVLGDDPAASTDSRRWGPLPSGAVRGRVVARYAPRERARRWRRGAARSAADARVDDLLSR